MANQTSTQAATVKINATVAQMQGMVKKVLITGKEVYVVVPNIEKFKAEAVEKLTKRENKRRTIENRFHWLLHTFIRENHNMKGKHMNVHLVAAAGPEVKAVRNSKGHYVKKENTFVSEKGEVITLDQMMATPELVPTV